jgi:hypothetical protein
MGARNSTFFEAENIIQSKNGVAFEKSNLWTGGQQLTWTPTTESRQLAFDIPVPESGKYVIRITGAMTPRSGRISAILNGQPLALATEDGTFDMKTDYRTLSRTVSTRDLELPKGKAVFVIQSEGPFEDKPVIGIDFLWLQKK